MSSGNNNGQPSWTFKVDPGKNVNDIVVVSKTIVSPGTLSFINDKGQTIQDPGTQTIVESKELSPDGTFEIIRTRNIHLDDPIKENFIQPVFTTSSGKPESVNTTTINLPELTKQPPTSSSPPAPEETKPSKPSARKRRSVPETPESSEKPTTVPETPKSIPQPTPEVAKPGIFKNLISGKPKVPANVTPSQPESSSIPKSNKPAPESSKPEKTGKSSPTSEKPTPIQTPSSKPVENQTPSPKNAIPAASSQKPVTSPTVPTTKSELPTPTKPSVTFSEPVSSSKATPLSKTPELNPEKVVPANNKIGSPAVNEKTPSPIIAAKPTSPKKNSVEKPSGPSTPVNVEPSVPAKTVPETKSSKPETEPVQPSGKPSEQASPPKSGFFKNLIGNKPTKPISETPKPETPLESSAKPETNINKPRLPRSIPEAKQPVNEKQVPQNPVSPSSSINKPINKESTPPVGASPATPSVKVTPETPPAKVSSPTTQNPATTPKVASGSPVAPIQTSQPNEQPTTTKPGFFKNLINNNKPKPESSAKPVSEELNKPNATETKPIESVSPPKKAEPTKTVPIVPTKATPTSSSPKIEASPITTGPSPPTKSIPQSESGSNNPVKSPQQTSEQPTANKPGFFKNLINKPKPTNEIAKPENTEKPIEPKTSTNAPTVAPVEPTAKVPATKPELVPSKPTSQVNNPAKVEPSPPTKSVPQLAPSVSPSTNATEPTIPNEQTPTKPGFFKNLIGNKPKPTSEALKPEETTATPSQPANIPAAKPRLARSVQEPTPKAPVAVQNKEPTQAGIPSSAPLKPASVPTNAEPTVQAKTAVPNKSEAPPTSIGKEPTEPSSTSTPSNETPAQKPGFFKNLIGNKPKPTSETGKPVEASSPTSVVPNTPTATKPNQSAVPTIAAPISKEGAPASKAPANIVPSSTQKPTSVPSNVEPVKASKISAPTKSEAPPTSVEKEPTKPSTTSTPSSETPAQKPGFFKNLISNKPKPTSEPEKSTEPSNPTKATPNSPAISKPISSAKPTTTLPTSKEEPASKAPPVEVPSPVSKPASVPTNAEPTVQAKAAAPTKSEAPPTSIGKEPNSTSEPSNETPAQKPGFFKNLIGNKPKPASEPEKSAEPSNPTKVTPNTAATSKPISTEPTTPSKEEIHVPKVPATGVPSSPSKPSSVPSNVEPVVPSKTSAPTKSEAPPTSIGKEPTEPSSETPAQKPGFFKNLIGNKPKPTSETAKPVESSNPTKVIPNAAPATKLNSPVAPTSKEEIPASKAPVAEIPSSTSKPVNASTNAEPVVQSKTSEPTKSTPTMPSSSSLPTNGSVPTIVPVGSEQPSSKPSFFKNLIGNKPKPTGEVPVKPETPVKASVPSGNTETEPTPSPKQRLPRSVPTHESAPISKVKSTPTTKPASNVEPVVPSKTPSPTESSQGTPVAGAKPTPSQQPATTSEPTIKAPNVEPTSKAPAAEPIPKEESPSSVKKPASAPSNVEPSVPSKTSAPVNSAAPEPVVSSPNTSEKPLAPKPGFFKNLIGNKPKPVSEPVSKPENSEKLAESPSSSKVTPTKTQPSSTIEPASKAPVPSEEATAPKSTEPQSSVPKPAIVEPTVPSKTSSPTNAAAPPVGSSSSPTSENEANPNEKAKPGFFKNLIGAKPKPAVEATTKPESETKPSELASQSKPESSVKPRVPRSIPELESKPAATPTAAIPNPTNNVEPNVHSKTTTPTKSVPVTAENLPAPQSEPTSTAAPAQPTTNEQPTAKPGFFKNLIGNKPKPTSEPTSEPEKAEKPSKSSIPSKVTPTNSTNPSSSSEQPTEAPIPNEEKSAPKTASVPNSTSPTSSPNNAEVPSKAVEPKTVNTSPKVSSELPPEQHIIPTQPSQTEQPAAKPGFFKNLIGNKKPKPASESIEKPETNENKVGPSSHPETTTTKPRLPRSIAEEPAQAEKTSEPISSSKPAIVPNKVEPIVPSKASTPIEANTPTSPTSPTSTNSLPSSPSETEPSPKEQTPPKPGFFKNLIGNKQKPATKPEVTEEALPNPTKATPNTTVPSKPISTEPTTSAPTSKEGISVPKVPATGVPSSSAPSNVEPVVQPKTSTPTKYEVPPTTTTKEPTEPSNETPAQKPGFFKNLIGNKPKPASEPEKSAEPSNPTKVTPNTAATSKPISTEPTTPSKEEIHVPKVPATGVPSSPSKPSSVPSNVEPVVQPKTSTPTKSEAPPTTTTKEPTEPSSETPAQKPGFFKNLIGNKPKPTSETEKPITSEPASREEVPASKASPVGIPNSASSVPSNVEPVVPSKTSAPTKSEAPTTSIGKEPTEPSSTSTPNSETPAQKPGFFKNLIGNKPKPTSETEKPTTTEPGSKEEIPATKAQPVEVPSPVSKPASVPTNAEPTVQAKAAAPTKSEAPPTSITEPNTTSTPSSETPAQKPGFFKNLIGNKPKPASEPEKSAEPSSPTKAPPSSPTTSKPISNTEPITTVPSSKEEIPASKAPSVEGVPISVSKPSTEPVVHSKASEPTKSEAPPVASVSPKATLEPTEHSPSVPASHPSEQPQATKPGFFKNLIGNNKPSEISKPENVEKPASETTGKPSPAASSSPIKTTEPVSHPKNVEPTNSTPKQTTENSPIETKQVEPSKVSSPSESTPTKNISSPVIESEPSTEPTKTSPTTTEQPTAKPSFFKNLIGGKPKATGEAEVPKPPEAESAPVTKSPRVPRSVGEPITKTPIEEPTTASAATAPISSLPSSTPNNTEPTVPSKTTAPTKSEAPVPATSTPNINAEPNEPNALPPKTNEQVPTKPGFFKNLIGNKKPTSELSQPEASEKSTEPSNNKEPANTEPNNKTRLPRSASELGSPAALPGATKNTEPTKQTESPNSVATPTKTGSSSSLSTPVEQQAPKPGFFRNLIGNKPKNNEQQPEISDEKGNASPTNTTPSTPTESSSVESPISPKTTTPTKSTPPVTTSAEPSANSSPPVTTTKEANKPQATEPNSSSQPAENEQSSVNKPGFFKNLIGKPKPASENAEKPETSEHSNETPSHPETTNTGKSRVPRSTAEKPTKASVPTEETLEPQAEASSPVPKPASVPINVEPNVPSKTTAPTKAEAPTAASGSSPATASEPATAPQPTSSEQAAAKPGFFKNLIGNKPKPTVESTTKPESEEKPTESSIPTKIAPSSPTTSKPIETEEVSQPKAVGVQSSTPKSANSPNNIESNVPSKASGNSESTPPLGSLPASSSEPTTTPTTGEQQPIAKPGFLKNLIGGKPKPANETEKQESAAKQTSPPSAVEHSSVAPEPNSSVKPEEVSKHGSNVSKPSEPVTESSVPQPAVSGKESEPVSANTSQPTSQKTPTGSLSSIPEEAEKPGSGKQPKTGFFKNLVNGNKPAQVEPTHEAKTASPSTNPETEKNQAQANNTAKPSTIEEQPHKLGKRSTNEPKTTEPIEANHENAVAPKSSSPVESQTAQKTPTGSLSSIPEGTENSEATKQPKGGFFKNLVGGSKPKNIETHPTNEVTHPESHLGPEANKSQPEIKNAEASNPKESVPKETSESSNNQTKPVEGQSSTNKPVSSPSSQAASPAATSTTPEAPESHANGEKGSTHSLNSNGEPKKQGFFKKLIGKGKPEPENVSTSPTAEQPTETQAPSEETVGKKTAESQKTEVPKIPAIVPATSESSKSSASQSPAVGSNIAGKPSVGKPGSPVEETVGSAKAGKPVTAVPTGSNENLNNKSPTSSSTELPQGSELNHNQQTTTPPSVVPSSNSENNIPVKNPTVQSPTENQKPTTPVSEQNHVEPTENKSAEPSEETTGNKPEKKGLVNNILGKIRGKRNASISSTDENAKLLDDETNNELPHVKVTEPSNQAKFNKPLQASNSSLPQGNSKQQQTPTSSGTDVSEKPSSSVASIGDYGVLGNFEKPIKKPIIGNGIEQQEINSLNEPQSSPVNGQAIIPTQQQLPNQAMTPSNTLPLTNNLLQGQQQPLQQQQQPQPQTVIPMNGQIHPTNLLNPHELNANHSNQTTQENHLNNNNIPHAVKVGGGGGGGGNNGNSHNNDNSNYDNNTQPPNGNNNNNNNNNINNNGAANHGLEPSRPNDHYHSQNPNVVLDMSGIHEAQRPNNGPGNQEENNENPNSYHNAKQQTGSHENALAIPENSQAPPRRPAIPVQVYYMVGSEFCERFSYYGLRAVMILYFIQVLGFTQSAAAVTFHAFVAVCYTTPIMGAILADSVLGKYRTILYLSLLYLAGEIILTISSISWDLGGWSVFLTLLSLLAIGIGTGGIKPSVSALLGDQVVDDEQRERSFGIFYAAINAGSLLSGYLTPVLKSQFECVDLPYCYPYAFAVPSILMALAIVAFVSAKKYYYIAPLPANNVVADFSSAVWQGIKNKFESILYPSAAPAQELASYGLAKNDNSSIKGSTEAIINSPDGKPVSDYHSIEMTPNSTDNSAINTNNARTYGATNGLAVDPQRTNFDTLKGGSPLTPSNGEYIELDGVQPTGDQTRPYVQPPNGLLGSVTNKFDPTVLAEFQSVLNLFWLFVPASLFWALYDQQSSLWTLQAARMSGKISNSFTIQPDQMAALNSTFLLLSIPLFHYLIYPSLKRCNILTNPIERMTAGGLFAALAFVVAALIEMRIVAYAPGAISVGNGTNLYIVNGLGNCAIKNPRIAYNLPKQAINGTARQSDTLELPLPDYVQPLSLFEAMLPPSTSGSNLYSVQFELTSTVTYSGKQASGSNSTGNDALNSGCPLDSTLQSLNLGELSPGTIKIVYIHKHFNGSLVPVVLDDDLTIPKHDEALLKIIYDFVEPVDNAQERVFDVTKLKSDGPHDKNLTVSSKWATQNGTVLTSHNMTLNTPKENVEFVLSSPNNKNGNASLDGIAIKLHPASKNLVIIKQNPQQSKLNGQHLVLSDNSHKISMLWQVFPYLLMAFGEVLFSITGLDFAYSQAPSSMKSIVLAGWSLTVSIGNILVVVIEAISIFKNPIGDFVFYAVLMVFDMIFFAYVGSTLKSNKQD